jgi:hypothetical protein
MDTDRLVVSRSERASESSLQTEAASDQSSRYKNEKV